MYLDGLVKANPIAYQQDRTVDGIPVMTIFSNQGGRQLSLGTSQLQGATQGIWCKSVLDDLKAVQGLGNPVTLDYHGDTYNVLITGTSDINQLLQFEPDTPNKKYTGTIKLIEV